MLSVISALMSVTTPIIIVFNIIGFTVGGIWLLIAGEWRIVIFAFAIDMLIPTIYSIITLPFTFLFNLPINYFAKKNMKIPTMIFGSLSLTFSNIINLIWVIAVFIYMTITAQNTDNSVIPFLLYGYSIATGPFTYMASKEPPDSYGTFLGVYLIQMSYIILSVLYLIHLLWLGLPIIILLLIVLEISLLKVTSELMNENTLYY
jgi:hypothetical protein